LVARSAAGTGLFVGGAAPTQVSEDGRTSVLQLAMPFEESDPRVDDAIRQLRSDLAPAALDGLGAEYAVGGDPAESLDFVDRQHQRLPLVIGFVLLLTLLIMAFTFRSLAIALVSTVLNLASVGVAFGLMTLVFQHGWFEGALDFSSPGFVIDWVPLFVLVVLVGLSMDYHVFVLSRVREHLQRGLPARLAVREGVADTAGVVTSAATVMVSVFAIFATLSRMEMKMMGVGLSAAILIDATVIRLVMLPAILVLLGERAWWPTRPTRPVGDVVEETEPAYELASS
jgi:RND superfamily putative drug exporter